MSFPPGLIERINAQCSCVLPRVDPWAGKRMETVEETMRRQSAIAMRIPRLSWDLDAYDAAHEEAGAIFEAGKRDDR